MTIPEIEKELKELREIIRTIGETANSVRCDVAELRKQLGVEAQPLNPSGESR